MLGKLSYATKGRSPDLGKGISRFQSTKKYHGTDIQLEVIGGKALGTSEGALS